MRVLHYTGMGKNGDQDIDWAQNATLAACNRNGVDVHLFEVMDAREYVYCGRIELVDKPYVDIQPGEDGNNRKVWMFPIRPVPDNDVKKKKSRKNPSEKLNQPVDVTPPIIQKSVVVPTEIVGKRVKHKSYGKGIITGTTGTIIIVSFNSVGEKKLGYEICMKNKLIEFV